MTMQFDTIKLTFLVLAVVLSTQPGCNTTRITDTSRTGMEQLLLSRAIDSSLDKVDFEGLAGKSVFVDERFLDCVDKKYIIGSVRQRAFHVGCRLVEKPEEADVVLEIMNGAVGTDRSEGFIGMPAINMPGPIPVQIPEIKLASNSTQFGTVKIGIVAYDPKSRRAISSGGLARARSTNRNWSVLGMGGLRSGNIDEEIKLTDITPGAPQIMLTDRTRSNVDPRVTRLPEFQPNPITPATADGKNSDDKLAPELAQPPIQQ